MEEIHQQRLRIAREVAQQSRDPSTKVGAIIVDTTNNSIVSSGFNRFPFGHDETPELYNNRVYKYANIVHAEVNALNLLPYRPINFLLYTSFHPCVDCVEFIARRGAAVVYCPRFDPIERPDWAERIESSRKRAEELGLQIKELDECRKQECGKLSAPV